MDWVKSVKTVELQERFANDLAVASERAAAEGLDAPVPLSHGQHLSTIGTLHLYAFKVPPDAQLVEDIPVSIVLPNNLEPAEGLIVGHTKNEVFIQTEEVVGQDLESSTLVPNVTGFLTIVSNRLAEMARHPEKYDRGPAGQLAPWLGPDQPDRQARTVSTAPVLRMIWQEDLAARRSTLAAEIVEQVRANKRLLVISPDHRHADEVTVVIAKALHSAGLPFKSLLSRYKLPVLSEAGGLALIELGFESQMHQLHAGSQPGKVALRCKYERFRELTLLLAYKGEKRRDLTEVKRLEWRLLSKISEFQGRIKEIEKTLGEYEAISIWKRLAMQTLGKNVASLGEYKTLYQSQTQDLMREVEVAQRRIEELSPEAATPKNLRFEYGELKGEIERLGGTRNIREMLAAEVGTNRQAFMQNKRVVVTTAALAVTDPVFGHVPFDGLLADEAPRIPAPFLLAAAGLIRERIVLIGDRHDVPSTQAWASTAFPSLDPRGRNQG